MISVNDLVKIAGRIASLGPALGFFTSCSAYASIAHHVDCFGWSGSTALTFETKREFKLFLDYAESLNSYPLLQDYRQQSIQSLLSSSASFPGDASAIGACAYSIQSPSKFSSKNVFSDEEMSLSSGHRELLTLKKAILLGLVPSSSSVVWRTGQGINKASFSSLQFQFLPSGFTLLPFDIPSNARPISLAFSQNTRSPVHSQLMPSQFHGKMNVFLCVPQLENLFQLGRKLQL